MNLLVVTKLTGTLLALIGLFMLAPLALAIYDRTGAAAWAYGVGALVTFGVACALRRIGRNAPEDVHRKDALGTVALTWLGIGLLGAVPFVLEGSISDPSAAVFEAVSGFTTTGATVVADVDGLTRATNLWRCLSHWVGGMGIVVLFVAIFPQLGVGAKHLFRTEVPGPITEGLRPKITQTALALWWIYAGLTALATVLLMFAGMSLFDAVCHAFSTLGTGGFSTRGASIGAYASPFAEWVCIAFMFIAGLNFGLYYGALRGNIKELFTNYEVRFYALVNVVVIAVITLLILGRHGSLTSAVRAAAFQTLAVTTTTGFMTEDFDTYPEVARFMLFGLMFMGACAGSTAGGIKASRVYAAIKLGLRELSGTVQPQGVVAIRLGNHAVPAGVLRGIAVYITTYILLFLCASLLMVAMGLDLVSASSSVVACLSSVGPGLGLVGPTQNFAFIPAPGKWLLSLCMIAGRLEIFALLAVFTPNAWRR